VTLSRGATGADAAFEPLGDSELGDGPPSSRLFLGKRTLIFLAALGGAAYASKSLENPERMARRLDGSPLEGLIDVGDQYGDGLTMGVGTAGLLLLGSAFESRALTTFGRDLARSLLVSGAAVWALKLSINARRPNGGPYSFPSGHTASAFAAAPVIARHWGWRAGAGALVLAAGTALGRMEDRRHYLGDVLFGAAIGLAVGYEVASNSGGVSRAEDGGGGGLGGLLRSLTLRPQGIGVSIRF
jgi:membrane-associated phospholipid phosphatase